ncbi:MAG: FHA domain-containing protein, partial [Pyrinomonadaceae bacterium]
MKLHLSIESGSLAGQNYELETGFLTIGRSETCSIRFDPTTERIASKQHAFIEARADGFYLTDNNSTNGTFLNRERVGVAKISSGDRIQFGSNGVTASVRIDSGQPQSLASGRQSYREYEVQQFNRTAENEPVNLQASLHNFGLGAAAAAPDAPKTGRYVGIAV